MIKKAEISQIDEIYKLLNEHLSFGILSKNTLKENIEKENILIYIKEGKVIGVLSFDAGEKIKEETKHDKKVYETVNMLHLENALYIKGIVVDPLYRKRGIGKTLLKDLLETCENKNVIAIGWKKPKGWKGESLFRALSFKTLLLVDKFWSMHPCPYCGESCKCAAVFVYKEKSKLCF